MIPLRDDQPCRKTPIINYFLIILNGLVFIFEWTSAQPSGAQQLLLYQFGIVPVRTLHLLAGTPVFDPVAAVLPIFTSMFLHASPLHLLGNLLFLYIFGDNVEDALGPFRHLMFYLSCGFAAGVTHILLNPGSQLPSIGASGAIAGVMGAYFWLYPRARVLMWFPPIFFFHLPAWLVLGYWFLVQLLSGAAALSPYLGQAGGIAFWAHVGGFVAGAVLIKLFPSSPQRYRYTRH